MIDATTLFGEPERPDPRAVAEYLADMAGEMQELAEGAGLREVAALMRAAVQEAGRLAGSGQHTNGRNDPQQPAA